MTNLTMDQQFESAWEIARDGLKRLAARGDEAEFILSVHWFTPPVWPVDILRRLPDDLVGEEREDGWAVLLRWKG